MFNRIRKLFARIFEAEMTTSPLTKQLLKRALNAWCPTGEGGGKDNSCSPVHESSGVEELAGTRVYRNPTYGTAKAWFKRSKAGLRFLRDPHNGTVYIWDAMDAVHQNIFDALHLEYDETVENADMEGEVRWEVRRSDTHKNNAEFEEVWSLIEYLKNDKPIKNAWCPTGEGGGKDNSCPPHNAGTSVAAVHEASKKIKFLDATISDKVIKRDSTALIIKTLTPAESDKFHKAVQKEYDKRRAELKKDNQTDGEFDHKHGFRVREMIKKEFAQKMFDEHPDWFMTTIHPDQVRDEMWYDTGNGRDRVSIKTDSGAKFTVQSNASTLKTASMKKPGITYSVDPATQAEKISKKDFDQLYAKVTPSIIAHIERYKPEVVTMAAKTNAKKELYNDIAKTITETHPQYFAAYQDLDNNIRFYTLGHKELQQEIFDTVPKHAVWTHKMRILNAWCPTGEGGGKDNSCSPTRESSGIEEIGTSASGHRLRLYRNFGISQLRNLLEQKVALRGMLDTKSKNYYFWDGHLDTHDEIADKLNLHYRYLQRGNWDLEIPDIYDSEDTISPEEVKQSLETAVKYWSQGKKVPDHIRIYNSQLIDNVQTSGKYSSTQCNINEPLASQIVAWTRANVPQEWWADDGIEEQVHITVKYGLFTDDADDVRRLIENQPPISARIGKLSIFEVQNTKDQHGGAKYDVLKLEILSDDLQRINKIISDSLPHADTHPVYNPHMTLVYLKPGFGRQFIGKDNPFTGMDLVFDEVSYSSKQQVHTPIDLIGVETFNVFCPTGKGGGVDPTCTKDDGFGPPPDASDRINELNKKREQLKGMLPAAAEKIKIVTDGAETAFDHFIQSGHTEDEWMESNERKQVNDALNNVYRTQGELQEQIEAIDKKINEIAVEHIPSRGDATGKPLDDLSWDEAVKQHGEDWVMQRMAAARLGEKEWERRIKFDLSMGRFTEEQARLKGFYNTSGRPYKALPETLYHVTTAADAVEKSGLRTRDELNQQKGKGLGGGDSDTISFTDDPKIAADIYAAMKEAHAVARGDVGLDDLVSAAKQGRGANYPFFDKLMSSYVGDKNPEGEPHEFQLIRQGKKIDYSKGGWDRNIVDMTPDEKRDAIFDVYRKFATYRESAGGALDPLFFLPDTEGFAKTPSDQIKIVKTTSLPGTQGFQVSALGEWRTHTGKAVKLDGKAYTIPLDQLRLVQNLCIGMHDTTNAWCPTGKGGGKDNSCSPTGGSASLKSDKDVKKIGDVFKQFGVGVNFGPNYGAGEGKKTTSLSSELNPLTRVHYARLAAETFEGLQQRTGIAALMDQDKQAGKFDIRILGDTEMENYLQERKKKPNVLGTYNIKDETITIKAGQITMPSSPAPLSGEGNVGTDFQTVLRHEYGHHAYHKLGLQDSWVEALRDDESPLSSVKSESVSRYATKNPSELFAEAFAAYTHPNYKRGMMPDSIELIMDDVVGVPAKGTQNAFCPTGKGGGKDNSCSPNRDAVPKFDVHGTYPVYHVTKDIYLPSILKQGLGSPDLMKYDPTKSQNPLLLDGVVSWTRDPAYAIDNGTVRLVVDNKQKLHQAGFQTEESVAMLATDATGDTLEPGVHEFEEVTHGIVPSSLISRIEIPPSLHAEMQKNLTNYKKWSDDAAIQQRTEQPGSRKYKMLGLRSESYRNSYDELKAVLDDPRLKVGEFHTRDWKTGDVLVKNAWCPTGPGGGKDNSCSPNGFRQSITDEFPGVTLDLYPRTSYSPNHKAIWDLSKIVVPKDQRKQGIGTEIMQRLIKAADAAGATLTLDPATDYGGTSKARLASFYKRFGFVPNKGRTADYTLSAAMYRVPQKKIENIYCPTGEGGGKDPTCTKDDGVTNTKFDPETNSEGNLKDDLDNAPDADWIKAVLEHYGCEHIENHSSLGDALPSNLYKSPDGDLIEFDGTDQFASFTSADDINQWVYEQDVSAIEDKIEERINDEFWESGGGEVYHATPSDNVESILKDGIGAASETRGMSNRNVGDAVYTTAEWDEAVEGSYGDAVFSINPQAMKADGYTPWVSLEPDCIEQEARETLAAYVDADDFHYDAEAGMSPNTIVIHGNVPAKYIKLEKESNNG